LPCESVLITAIAVTSDGRAATGSFSGDVTVWDLVTGQPKVCLHTQANITSLALSPAGDRLLVGSDGLAVYQLMGMTAPGLGSARLLARLLTSYDVTAIVINP